MLYWRVIRVYIEVGFIVDFVDGRRRDFLEQSVDFESLQLR
jgi:hypothetical protein